MSGRTRSQIRKLDLFKGCRRSTIRAIDALGSVNTPS